MKYRVLLFFTILLFCFLSSMAQNNTVATDSLQNTEQNIINRFLKNGAWKVNYFSPEYQLYIDSAIALNPNIAYLYQQKAMPYFKQQKYEIGLLYLNKAVELNPKKYIDYRAFIECVFAKTYKQSILDFNTSKSLNGNQGFVMDHSYDFYIGLCYLQLNEYQIALNYFETSMRAAQEKNGENWIHYLEQFYAGIANQELSQHQEAIKYFNKALKTYPHFADAKYYKAKTLIRLNQTSEANELFKSCIADYEMGYTINEDNVFYEFYPYQLKPFMINGIKQTK